MQELFSIQAMAQVTAAAAGVGVTPTYAANSGFTAGAGAHTAVGIYDCNLDTPIDPADSFLFVSAQSANPDTNVAASHVDDTTKRVTTSVAGVASDAVSFNLMVVRRPST